jgi:diguanylate cyclase (GGDEF)-like protein
MPNFQISDPAISRRLFDSWQTVVNLISEYLNIPTAELLLCHGNSTEVVCTNKNNGLLNDIYSVHPNIINDAVLHLQNRLHADDLVQGELFEQGKPIWYCGVILRNPFLQQFGLVFLTDNQPRKLSQSQLQLLSCYKQMIEAQLKVELQAIEINQLKIQNGLSLSSSNTERYTHLTKTLSQEILKRKNIEEQLNYHKFHDLGTGFLNRFALEVELRNHLTDDEHAPQNLAIIHVGFSNAKNLQSRFGYQEWEKVLTQYRERLQVDESKIKIQTARPNSTDLALLIACKNLKHHVDSICEQLLDINKSEFSIDNQTIHLHSYIGISTSHETSAANELLEQASSAMLSCKDSGHGFCYHSQALAESQSQIHQLENYLLQAVRNGDLMLYFQPKVCPISKRWTGAEALLRWRHAVLGEISTETLIHLAEKNGLIFEVGSFVLRTAIEKASQWLKHVKDFKMAVNISAKQLKDVRFVEQIKQLLAEYNLPPQYLEIEVTESGLITDEKVASDILQVLHELGITLSLDDFGTGYASFNYLKKFPFDCIKIDKSFIHPLEHSEDDKEIVRSIIQVAKKLKLQVIIEGVETKAQEAFVINEGCDFGQGFLYGRPMPADDFEVGLMGQYPTLNLSWIHH